jgi:hypothetical protein
MKNYVTLIFLFIGILTFSQTFHLSGKVTDEENTPVDFAEVILSVKDSVLKSELTGEDGSFTFSSLWQENYTLAIKQAGEILHTQNLFLTDNLDLGNIRIQKAKELQNVVVTGQRKLFERKGDKLIFNVENSEIAKGGTALDVLYRSPKLSMNADGNILLRNKTATILINGKKSNLSEPDLRSYLSGLNSEDIKYVEIQDVASSDQDASSHGGVINIVLKTPPKGFRAIAKTIYLHRENVYGTHNGNLNINYGLEKWAVYANIDYTKNRDLGKFRESFNYNSGSRNADKGSFIQENDNLGLRGGTIFSPNKKNDIGIEGYFNKNNATYNSNTTLNIFQDNKLQTMNDNQSLEKINNHLWYLTLNYTLKIDSLGSNLKFIGDVGENNSQPYSELLTNYPNSVDDSHHLYNTHAISKYYTLQSDWLQKIKKDWEIITGAKFGSVKRDNQLFTQYYDYGKENWINDIEKDQNFDNRENILAGYISISKKLNKHLFKAGLRIENTDVNGFDKITNQKVRQNYTDIFPNFYYQYDLGEEKNISLTYRRNITRPLFSNLTPFVMKRNDYLYIIGNPHLQPSYKNNLELALNLKKQSFTFYFQKTNDLIKQVYFTNTDQINYNQPQNFGKYLGTGIDHFYNGNIVKWLYANISSGVYYNSFIANDEEKTCGSSFYNNL